jgi:N utilization substance protein B
MHKVDLNYYHELLTQVVAIMTIGYFLIPVLDRELTALDGVELATLRLAYELRDHLEIPYRVVLDEASSLQNFGGADSHKYINGVLDRLATFVKLKNNKLNNNLCCMAEFSIIERYFNRLRNMTFRHR